MSGINPTMVITYAEHAEQVGVAVQGTRVDGLQLVALEFDKVVRGGLMMSSESARKFAHMLLAAAEGGDS